VRRQPVPIEPAATLHIELAERLRVTASRLDAMPADSATSLSITTGWQGRSEADIRALAATVAKPLRLRPVIEARGDSVTVTFQRSGLDDAFRD
jgi:hypothetical protein